MLATWVLAYSERITSSRVLEQKCIRDHYYIYTSGDLEPDYSTLCRFRTTPIETILKEKDRKVEQSDFVFHEEDDNYECPAGEKLEFKNTYKNGDVTGRVYEKATPCTRCALFERCFDKKNKTGIKRIYRDDREYLAYNINKLNKSMQQVGQNPPLAQQNAQKSAQEGRDIAEKIYFFLLLSILYKKFIQTDSRN